jgi:phosphatidylglycerophosphate synthase
MRPCEFGNTRVQNRLTIRSQSVAGGRKQVTRTTDTISLCILGHSDVRLWDMSPATRLTRAFNRAGITNTVDENELANHLGPVILVRADAVLDEPLIAHLVTRKNLMILGDGPEGTVPVAAHVNAKNVLKTTDAINYEINKDLSGIEICTPDDLDASYWKALRKRETPYALILTDKNSTKVQWRVFMGTYKGATDFITKHLWPRPAFHVTRWIAPHGITPNLVTTLSAYMVILAFYWFMQGNYGAGLVAAWLMTFLDTVDGKLARVTLTSSPWGNVFDHGIDLIHPPFWYWAWGVGLANFGMALEQSTFYWLYGVIIGGYVLQRILEGLAITLLGMEIHIWRPVDTFFR